VKLPLLPILLSAASLHAAAQIDSREVSFTSAGYRLQGTLTAPAREPARASVLILGGSGPIDRNGASPLHPAAPPNYRLWAERLSEAGYAVLRYDKRFLTYPDIDLLSFDQEAHIADALAAVAFLRARRDDSGKVLFLLGHSEGGTLAVVAARRAAPIAGLVVVNAVQFPVDELLLAQLAASPTIPKAAVDEVRGHLAKIKDGSFPARGQLLGAGKEYWAQWIRNSGNSPAVLAELQVPVLLVQSLADETLPGETLSRNVEVLRAVARANRNAQLLELAYHDHFAVLRTERQPSAEFTQGLVDWLRRSR